MPESSRRTFAENAREALANDLPLETSPSDGAKEHFIAMTGIDWR
jgi:hypothetical protein